MADDLINMFNRIAAAVKAPRPKTVAATTALSMQKDRIFNRGLATDGSQIGQYSTNPISISPSRQARNTGKTFFKGGYSEYKSDIGKNPGHVNLRNTDQMMGDYGVIQDGGDVAIGFQNDTNSEKRGWMEEKYGKDIFDLDDKEIDTSVQVLIDEQNKEF